MYMYVQYLHVNMLHGLNSAHSPVISISVTISSFISFQFPQSFHVGNSKITSICGVNDTMWLGTEKGVVFIYDAISRNFLLERLLAVLDGQGITAIAHVSTNHQVLVTRRDGCILLFDEGILEHRLPDDSRYDNRVNATPLPVRSVFKTPERLPIVCAQLVKRPDETKVVVWCGTRMDMLLAFDVFPSRIEYCRKLYNRPRYKSSEEHCVTQVVAMVTEGKTCVWALSQPGSVLYCWDSKREVLLQIVECGQFTSDPGMVVCTYISCTTHTQVIYVALGTIITVHHCIGHNYSVCECIVTVC